ncbi:MAG: YveK family protein, partial [Clostridium sp.]|uniref:YveK family protein n=1 Tax=Clostridium sp. TaxID=1506 RepID=UPI003EE4895A
MDNKNQSALNVKELIYTFKKRWKLIIITTILITAITGLFSAFVIKPTYKSTMKVFVGKEGLEGQNYSSQELDLYSKLMGTYIELMNNPDFIERVIKNKNLSATTGEILGGLSIVESNQFMVISYSNKNKEKTKPIIDAVVSEFMVYSKEIITTGNLRIVLEAKVPTNPISPNVPKNTILGFLVGLILSIGIVLVLDYLDNTFKSESDVTEVLNIPLVGAI